MRVSVLRAVSAALLMVLLLGGCIVTPPDEPSTDVSVPETTEPETTEPETTEPETTEPETTEPETTEPETTEPETTEPETTEPETTEPEATEPETTEPEAIEPETTEPEATEPETTEPEATEPETTEPETTEPEATEPETTEPETTEPEITAPETTVPEIAESDPLLYLTDEVNTYTFIRAANLGTVAKKASSQLINGLPYRLSSDSDTAAESDWEILLGDTNRPESTELAQGLHMFDYRIAVMGEKIVAVGGSDEALVHAFKRMLTDLKDGVISRDYKVSFEGAVDRDAYIANPDMFLVNWAMDYDVPDWMRDFEEKKAAFADPDGRLMSSFHRGDGKNYPENSIEAVISAIHAGADNIEIDVYKTRDGVLVLMHEPTLDRMTNFAEMAGKNGLPTSNVITDWSFEELRALRLKYNGKVTEYLIPTLEEVLTVCRGRTTIRLDRIDQWDWDEDIFPLIEETGAWEAVLLHNMEDGPQRDVINQLLDSGAESVFGLRNFPHTHISNWQTYHRRLTNADHPYILHWSGFDINNYETYLTAAAVFTEEYKDECRIHALCHNAGKENAKVWKKLYENGVDFIMVDNGVALCRHIAKTFTPTEY